MVGESSTLNDRERHYALCHTNHASFGAHHENSKEDRLTLPAAKCNPQLYFYMVKGGFVARELQSIVWSAKRICLWNFLKANMTSDIGFSMTLECTTLNDLDMPF